jgi:TRAP-type mannitol/chloroaromatic compound transport system permease small subunit
LGHVGKSGSGLPTGTSRIFVVQAQKKSADRVLLRIRKAPHDCRTFAGKTPENRQLSPIYCRFLETCSGDRAINPCVAALQSSDLFGLELVERDGEVTMFLRGLDRLIGYVVAAAKWLALPLITLLFLQWPLRDLFRSYSREANDVGQVVFALFVAVSITAATRAGTHLAADLLAQRYSARTRRRLKQVGAAVGLLPWALFVLIAGKSTVVPSVQHLESFQDSGNPGYFLIKVALWVMAAAILCQSLVDMFRPSEADDN